MAIRTPSTCRISAMNADAREIVRYPWAMVVPNGPALPRSGSTWIHWWSSVASANRSTCRWVMARHSPVPRCGWSVARAIRSVGRATRVVIDGVLRFERCCGRVGIAQDGRWSRRLGRLTQAFEDHGHAHAAADAHGFQADLLVTQAQAIDQC